MHIVNPKVTQELVQRCLLLSVMLPLVLLLAMDLCTDNGWGQNLRVHPKSIPSLELEITAHGDDPRYLAALKGLRWCVNVCRDEEKFRKSFTRYLALLDQLTLNHPRPSLMSLVHRLILEEFTRALPAFPSIFPADADGYVAFLSILPTAYHHQIPIAPLREFARSHFGKVIPADRLHEFRQAAKNLDYARLSDLINEALLLDQAYRRGADKDFRLPPNILQSLMASCAALPFQRKEPEPGYREQNYFATHLVSALSHCGAREFEASSLGDRVFFYLTGEYGAVRHRRGDLHLLCGFLTSLRQFAPTRVGFIREGEIYLMSLQRSDGGWGAFDGPNTGPEDRLDPTGAAVTLLAQK